jgi:DNA-binding MarR family transcriptional regulator
MAQKTDALSNFHVLRFIRDARNTKHSARIVLTALALRIDPTKHYSCFPSVDQLAADTQLEPKTVRKAIASLVAAKLVKQVDRPYTSSLFFINVQLLAELASATLAAEKEAKELQKSPFGEVTLPEDAMTETTDDGDDWDQEGAR